MKNLERYGVQEMGTKEVNETRGGIVPIIIAAYAIDLFVLSFMAGTYYELRWAD